MKIILVIAVLLLSLNLAACGAGSVAGDLSVNDLSVGDSDASGVDDISLDSSNADSLNTDGLNTDGLNTDGSSNSGQTGVVVLNWTPPTEFTDGTLMNDLAGYKVYYGIDSDELMFFINIEANLSSYVIENDQRLQTGATYYFGITGYSNAGVESTMSNIVYKEL